MHTIGANANFEHFYLTQWIWWYGVWFGLPNHFDYICGIFEQPRSPFCVCFFSKNIPIP